MFKSISKYLSLVKFAHTIFAMPFALMAFAYALWSTDAEFSWWLLVQVVLCMVFARNVAMGFNRWADRDIDKENPRTAEREIPAGVISPRKAMIFVVVNAILFIATACTINTLTAILSPVALAVIMFYSYCKRFTALAHIVLGLSLAIAPAGAYIAVTGTLSWAVCLLSLLVLTWCGGFDIIYALQDAEFDRERGLHSIPSTFSVATSLYISIALHCASVAALVAFALLLPQSWVLWCGVALFTAILVAEHILVTPKKQRSIGIAFGTLNGLASLTLAAFVIANILIFG
ncbi:MAG: putative 4-hydroxybenzoate polyprenyltransferase [Alistipes sp.]|nr:putative 4-hydroxybenzoate polyprenyltransferase [Alistipes sp.]